MKIDIMLQRISKRLPILCGCIFAGFLGGWVVNYLLFHMDDLLGNDLLASEEQFIVVFLFYLVLLSVFVFFIIKNRVILKTALVHIGELYFFSRTTMMLYVASGLLGMVMWITLMFSLI